MSTTNRDETVDRRMGRRPELLIQLLTLPGCFVAVLYLADSLHVSSMLRGTVAVYVSLAGLVCGAVALIATPVAIFGVWHNRVGPMTILLVLVSCFPWVFGLFFVFAF